MRRIHDENIGRMKAANAAAVELGECAPGTYKYNIETQKYVVILDVYSVHRSKEVRLPLPPAPHTHTPTDFTK